MSITCPTNTHEPFKKTRYYVHLISPQEALMRISHIYPFHAHSCLIHVHSRRSSCPSHEDLMSTREDPTFHLCPTHIQVKSNTFPLMSNSCPLRSLLCETHVPLMSARGHLMPIPCPYLLWHLRIFYPTPTPIPNPALSKF